MKRPWELGRLDLCTGLACLALLAARLWTLHLGGFGHYHGINEAHYSLVARGYNTHFWEPRTFDGRPFHDTPPLAGYAIWVSFLVFGENEFAARLPSLLMAVPALVGTFFLARKLHGAQAARWAALFFAAMPWTLLWFGRAQTDAYVTGFLALASGLIVHSRDRRWTLPAGCASIVLAGASKQVAIFAIPALLLWIVGQPWPREEKRDVLRRALAWSLAFSLPLAAYFLFQLQIGSEELVGAYFGRRPIAFENIQRNLFLGLVVGGSPGVFALAAWQARRGWRRAQLMPLWMIVFLGLFIFWAAPAYHEYYTLPLMPFIAVLAGAGFVDLQAKVRGRRSTGWVRAGGASVLVGSALLSVLLLGFSGDFGDRSSEETGMAVRQYVQAHPGERVVLVAPFALAAPLQFYLRDAIEDGSLSLEIIGHDAVPSEPTMLRLEGTYDHALVAVSGATPPGTRQVVDESSYGFLFVEEGSWIQERATDVGTEGPPLDDPLALPG